MTNKPMLSVELQMTERQECDLMRFYDTCEDSQPYDVPKDRMKSLARLGLVRSLGFSRYEFTDIGCAAIEKLRAFLDKQSCGTCGGCHNGCKLDRESPPIEPAAQHQGAHVAEVNEGDDGLFIEFIYGENGNPLKRGDKLYLRPSEQPAPVAVVMPEFESAFEAWLESDGQYCRAGGGSYEKTFAYRAYEAALAEVTRLNTPQ